MLFFGVDREKQLIHKRFRHFDIFRGRRRLKKRLRAVLVSVQEKVDSIDDALNVGSRLHRRTVGQIQEIVYSFCPSYTRPPQLNRPFTMMMGWRLNLGFPPSV